MNKITGTLTHFAGLLLVVTAGGAQFAPPPLELGFANPGARSMGFGGAFVALADDATAAFSNPAGLTQLNRMEISFETRGEIEDRPGFSVSAVGFASFVYPRKNFSLALYHTGLADLDYGVTTTGPLVGDELFFFRSTATLEARVTGLAAAWRVKEGLAVGLGLVLFRTRLSGDFEELVLDLRDFSPQMQRVHAANLDGASTELRLNAGVLWDFAPAWRLGAFYRQGTRLEVDFLGTFGPASDSPARPSVSVAGTPISFPDTFGLGFAWKTFRDRLTTSFEWDRVEHSTTLDSLDRQIFDTESYTLDDSDNVHLGFEYVIASKPAVAARLGTWREDTPRLHRLDGPSRPIGGVDEDDLDHFTGGVGIAFRKLQLDFGFDTSDVSDLVSVSVIYSFR